MNNFIENPDTQSISISQIESLQEKINSKLPEDYVNFLLDTNGGMPKNDSFDFVDIENKTNSTDVMSFCGISHPTAEDIIAQTDCFKDVIPSGFIVIAYDSGGSQILMKPENGNIYLWDHQNDFEWEDDELEMNIKPNVYKIADSFTEFFNFKLYFFDI